MKGKKLRVFAAPQVKTLGRRENNVERGEDLGLVSDSNWLRQEQVSKAAVKFGAQNVDPPLNVASRSCLQNRGN